MTKNGKIAFYSQQNVNTIIKNIPLQNKQLVTDKNTTRIPTLAKLHSQMPLHDCLFTLMNTIDSVTMYLLTLC